MILLRHGQTVFNLQFSATRVDPGVPDPGLTDLGRNQAADAAKVLKGRGKSVRQVFASPYSRAIETAVIVAEALGDAEVTIDPDIRELAGYSCDIGSSPADLQASWPKLDFSALEERWWAHPGGDPAAGGLDEPEASLAARVDRFRSRIARHDSWAEVLVVCHWGPIRAMIGRRVENGQFARHDPRGPMGLELRF